MRAIPESTEDALLKGNQVRILDRPATVSRKTAFAFDVPQTTGASVTAGLAPAGRPAKTGDKSGDLPELSFQLAISRNRSEAGQHIPTRHPMSAGCCVKTYTPRPAC